MGFFLIKTLFVTVGKVYAFFPSSSDINEAKNDHEAQMQCKLATTLLLCLKEVKL